MVTIERTVHVVALEVNGAVLMERDGVTPSGKQAWFATIHIDGANQAFKLQMSPEEADALFKMAIADGPFARAWKVKLEVTT
jgi:hypothetical protein